MNIRYKAFGKNIPDDIFPPDWEGEVFNRLNQLLELGGTRKYEELYDSYVRVILDMDSEKPDLSDYSELDFQVKFLIEEVKIPVNRVLLFGEAKYPEKEKSLSESINSFTLNINQSLGESISQEVFKQRKGKIFFAIVDGQNRLLDKIEIDFDIDGDFAKLIEDLKKISLEKYIRRSNIISIKAGVLK